jgi:hypothetical protein
MRRLQNLPQSNPISKIHSTMQNKKNLFSISKIPGICESGNPGTHPMNKSRWRLFVIRVEMLNLLEEFTRSKTIPGMQLNTLCHCQIMPHPPLLCNSIPIYRRRVERYRCT